MVRGKKYMPEQIVSWLRQVSWRAHCLSLLKWIEHPAGTRDSQLGRESRPATS
jgi:hypothetical protein